MKGDFCEAKLGILSRIVTMSDSHAVNSNNGDGAIYTRKELATTIEYIIYL